MNWNEHKAIYLQIADRIIEDILNEKLKSGDRVASVRELAAQIQVNPNTVVRSYGMLEQAAILHNQRGLGFYIAEGAIEKARVLKRTEFLEQTLPEVFKTMQLLQISVNELMALHHQFQNISQ